MAEFNIFGEDESFVSSLKEFFKKHGHDVRFHTSASHPDGHLDMSLPQMAKDYPTLAELEKRYIEAILVKTRGRKERAAKILGINRRTLYRKEREYGWVTEDSEDLSSEVEPEES
jgi:DNA-binding NtrC family response regulator